MSQFQRVRCPHVAWERLLQIAGRILICNQTNSSERDTCDKITKKSMSDAMWTGRTAGLDRDPADVQVATFNVATFAASRYFVLTNTLTLRPRGSNRSQSSPKLEGLEVRNP